MTVATGKDLVRNGAAKILTSTSTDVWLADGAENLAAFVSTENGGFLLRGSTTPAADITSTSTGFLNVAVPVDDNTAFLITWSASATSTETVLTVDEGEARRGWQQGKGRFQFDMISTAPHQGHQWIIGPFESARFGRVSCSTGTGGFGSGSSDIGLGQTFVRFHFYSSEGATAQVRHVAVMPFRMPRVTYDT
jgi:hypothetical protein